jgi:SAM-dependent methyltransferase
VREAAAIPWRSVTRAQFVGVDLSGSQVADGNAVVHALELSNVRLIARIVMDIYNSFGQLDYIIAHGIYSWVPNEVQERILEICNRNLVSKGVAYVSYNTLPGWRTRGVIRDLMRYHALQFSEADKRVAEARTILDFLAEESPTRTVHREAAAIRAGVAAQHPTTSCTVPRGAERAALFHEFIERISSWVAIPDRRRDCNHAAIALPPGIADTVRKLASI